MRKVKLFTTRENYEVDDQVNDFIERTGYEIVDMCSNTFLDTTRDIIMTGTLLIYEETEKTPNKLDMLKEWVDENCFYDNDTITYEEISDKIRELEDE